MTFLNCPSYFKRANMSVKLRSSCELLAKGTFCSACNGVFKTERWFSGLSSYVTSPWYPTPATRPESLLGVLLGGQCGAVCSPCCAGCVQQGEQRPYLNSTTAAPHQHHLSCRNAQVPQQLFQQGHGSFPLALGISYARHRESEIYLFLAVLD